VLSRCCMYLPAGAARAPFHPLVLPSTAAGSSIWSSSFRIGSLQPVLHHKFTVPTNADNAEYVQRVKCGIIPHATFRILHVRGFPHSAFYRCPKNCCDEFTAWRVDRLPAIQRRSIIQYWTAHSSLSFLSKLTKATYDKCLDIIITRRTKTNLPPNNIQTDGNTLASCVKWDGMRNENSTQLNSTGHVTLTAKRDREEKKSKSL